MPLIDMGSEKTAIRVFNLLVKRSDHYIAEARRCGNGMEALRDKYFNRAALLRDFADIIHEAFELQVPGIEKIG